MSFAIGLLQGPGSFGALLYSGLLTPMEEGGKHQGQEVALQKKHEQSSQTRESKPMVGPLVHF